MTPELRKNLLIVAIVLILGSIFYLESTKNHPPQVPMGDEIPLSTSTETLAPESPAQTSAPAVGTTSTSKITAVPGVVAKVSPPSAQTLATKKAEYPRAKEFVLPSGYTNAEPFLLKDLIGKKVILIDFWTYSCINCQRTIPYLNDWYKKYKDKGLVIVGVHTPEFEFEKSKVNVDKAVQKFLIQYPVVLDNENGTWNAYGNRYWPHEYLIDIDGFIVDDHIGEGGYADTEAAIQRALAERDTRLGISEIVTMPIVTPKDAIAFDASKVASAETYFGSARNTYLGGGTSLKEGMQTFDAVVTVNPNTLYLSKIWNFTPEYAQSMVENAGITYRYTAKNVYMVLGAQKMTRIKVLRDGVPLDTSVAGADIRFEKGESVFYVSEERLYDIVSDKAGYGTHTLEFTIETPGLQAFTFTFG